MYTASLGRRDGLISAQKSPRQAQAFASAEMSPSRRPNDAVCIITLVSTMCTCMHVSQTGVNTLTSQDGLVIKLYKYTRYASSSWENTDLAR